MQLKLDKYISISGQIICKSGLRIGGTKESLDIGGSDNPVIRHPLTKVPYIPGSSLKGKLRSLLEYKTGKIGDRGEPCGCAAESCLVCRIFGPHKRSEHTLGPSRIIVRDAMMTEESVEQMEPLKEEGSLYTEMKSENWIDRRTGIAGRGGLRNQERIPAGAAFDFNISLRIFEGDDEAEILSFIRDGLKLITKDAVGGSGTRGYGWVDLEYEVGESE